MISSFHALYVAKQKVYVYGMVVKTKNTPAKKEEYKQVQGGLTNTTKNGLLARTMYYGMGCVLIKYSTKVIQ